MANWIFVTLAGASLHWRNASAAAAKSTVCVITDSTGKLPASSIRVPNVNDATGEGDLVDGKAERGWRADGFDDHVRAMTAGERLE
jgi:hypothetical protein